MLQLLSVSFFIMCTSVFWLSRNSAENFSITLKFFFLNFHAVQWLPESRRQVLSGNDLQSWYLQSRTGRSCCIWMCFQSLISTPSQLQMERQAVVSGFIRLKMCFSPRVFHMTQISGPTIVHCLGIYVLKLKSQSTCIDLTTNHPEISFIMCSLIAHCCNISCFVFCFCFFTSCGCFWIFLLQSKADHRTYYHGIKAGEQVIFSDKPLEKQTHQKLEILNRPISQWAAIGFEQGIFLFLTNLKTGQMVNTSSIHISHYLWAVRVLLSVF